LSSIEPTLIPGSSVDLEAPCRSAADLQVEDESATPEDQETALLRDVDLARRGIERQRGFRAGILDVRPIQIRAQRAVGLHCHVYSADVHLQ
jgi:hypothetical protein